VGKRRAPEVGHADGLQAAGAVDRVNGHDVGVLQPRQQMRLALEVDGDLESHGSLGQAALACEEDPTKSSATEFGDQREALEIVADGRQCRRGRGQPLGRNLGPGADLAQHLDDSRGQFAIGSRKANPKAIHLGDQQRAVFLVLERGRVLVAIVIQFRSEAVRPVPFEIDTDQLDEDGAMGRVFRGGHERGQVRRPASERGLEIGHAPIRTTDVRGSAGFQKIGHRDVPPVHGPVANKLVGNDQQVRSQTRNFSISPGESAQEAD